MDAALIDRLTRLADHQEIRELVRTERFARDQRRWDVMAACFHPDAHIRTSWYDGNAVDYIPATQRMMEKSPWGKHWVFPGYIRQNGDRATVESPALIHSRLLMGDVMVDAEACCRQFSRVERRENVWRLSSFEVLWERDIMRPVNPDERLPIDPERLAHHRFSYRHFACMQESRGFTVNHDLLGDDRPEELAAFHAGEEAWLQEGSI